MSQTHSTNPLVSIVICSYNSSEYILETLESTINQNYSNIELIISDDCSTDNTVDICRKWINDNSDHFTRAEILTAEKNTGIAGNLNRGIGASMGEWIKPMAADDIFLPGAIDKNIDHIHSSKDDISILYSRCIFLIGDECIYEHPRIKYYQNNETEFNKSARRQFLSIIRENFACPPTVFIKKETIDALGGYDESFLETEDTPLLLKATSRGIKLFFFPENTVVYRYHTQSLSEQYYHKWVFIDEKIFKKYFTFKYKLMYPLQYWDFKITLINKKRIIHKKPALRHLKLINPLAIKRALVRKMEKTSEEKKNH